MKRTEKIEVRVSQEEKDTLTKLARQEGESVSGLLRGLVDKYMALNAANTKRRLPKWQLAGLLIGATIIGHGLTLIPMHLHYEGHNVEARPVYYVHGAIGNSAFGISLDKNNSGQNFTIKTSDSTYMSVDITLSELSDSGGVLHVSACERLEKDSTCELIFEDKMSLERVAPSVLGRTINNERYVHLFVQELA